MRFINIVLLELCAVAGSTFASALPQLFDGRVHQNPITGSCLQEPHVQEVNIRYLIRPPGAVFFQTVPLLQCEPLNAGPGFVRWIENLHPKANCELFRWELPLDPCHADNPRYFFGPGSVDPTNFYATHIYCSNDH